MNEEVLLRVEKPSVHPVVFEGVDENTVKEAALKTKGASGSSGLDADGWRKIIVSKSYGTINADLRQRLPMSLKKYAQKSSLLTQRKMKHHLKRFWLAD